MTDTKETKEKPKRVRVPSTATAINACIRALSRLSADEQRRALRCVLAYVKEGGEPCSG
jgi:hypothetical protein